MKEVWKDIDGYIGIYQVSDCGNIRVLPRKLNHYIAKSGFGLRSGKNMKLFVRSGYLRVILKKEDERKTYSVHRIVAEHFIANPCNKSEVNHKDGNKSNNKVYNLEWCNRSENQQHAFDTGLQVSAKGSSHPNAIIDEETVLKIRERYAQGGITIKEISKVHNISNSSAFNIIRRKSWTHI